MRKNVKRAAVFTLYGEGNYGNKLQNYAVYVYLQKLGYKAVTQAPVQSHSMKAFLKRAFICLLVNVLPFTLVQRLFAKKLPYWVRNVRFRHFTKEYIPTQTVDVTSPKKLQALAEDYDVFVTGSDQVWNPFFLENETDYNCMFLRFAPRKKRICFSPSIGVSTIPQAWQEKFRQGFNGFEKLCVREQSAADMIEELTGRRADVLADPTLLLSAAEWEVIEKPIKQLQKPYVLQYFLGNQSDEMQKAMQAFWSDGAEAIDLMNPQSPYYCLCGPSEFLYLIRHAEMVCTDSFHACVFSILFHKPFMVFGRQDENADMSARITTLLQLFEADTSAVGTRVIQIPEKQVEAALARERQKVRDFLSASLQQEI